MKVGEGGEGERRRMSKGGRVKEGEGGRVEDSYSPLYTIIYFAIPLYYYLTTHSPDYKVPKTILFLCSIGLGATKAKNKIIK